MAAQEVKGTNAFTEQPKRREYVQGRGWVTKRVWRGPRALLDAKAQDLLDALEPESMLTVAGTPAEIEVEVPDPGGLAEQSAATEEKDTAWELIPVRIERDLSAHGYFNSTSMNAGVIEAIEEALKHGEGAAYEAELAGNQPMLDYLALRIRGVEAFSTYTWMMKATMVTRKTGDVRAAMANIGKVHTYAEAIGSTPVNPNATPLSASTFKWNPPTILHYTNWEEAGAYGAGWQEIPVNEWLKQPPEVRQYTAGRRKCVAISMEYHGAVSWSSALYARTTAAGAGVVVGVTGRSTGGKKR